MATIDYKQKIKDYMNSSEVDTLYKSMLNNLFPELKESEDEKIRKDIIVLVKDWWDRVNKDNISTKEQMIAWLNKQGEHANFRNKIQIGDKVTRNEDGVLVNLSQLKRIAKKDEKQGEQKPAEEYNITGISSNKSQGKLGEIIKNLKTTWSEEDENYHRICLDLCTGMPNGGVYAPYIKDEAINWLKSIKDRVQPQQEWSEKDKNLFKCAIDAVKQESKVRTDGCLDEEVGEKVINWLKSIKERYTWKPSDEQMVAIQEAMNIVGILTITGSKINSLYQDLKKLRKK